MSLGLPSKFQPVSRLGFVTAPTSLYGGQPNFARCLAVSWASTPYIHFGGCCPLTDYCQLQVHFMSKSCVLLYCSVTARHSSSGSQPNFVAWFKERNYRAFAEGVTYIRLGGHHVVIVHFPWIYCNTMRMNSYTL